MIELTILKHLSEHLNVNVALEKPDPIEKSYVLFEKTGSNKKNHLPSSTFAFQSYAESLYKAAELNESVKRAVESLETNGAIVSVKLNSDYNYTDTSAKQYRYQAVFDINHY